MATGRTSPFTALLAAAAVILALGIRLYDLDRRTITHPEVYVPGINLPAYVVEPSPHRTVPQVLRGTLTGDIHPPAFYLMGLGWTSAFGTKIFTIRLPSVLFGTAAVLLVYIYGRRELGSAAALFAAVLLALHGEHVFWSQHARMWAMLSCLAIGSALLLVRLREEGGWSTAVLYVGVAAVGLWTEYYFWPLFIAQVLWTAARVPADRRALACLDAQSVAAVLGTPVLVYFHYQTQRGNFLPPDPRQQILAMLPFASSVACIVIAAIAIAAGLVARRSGTRVDSTSGKPGAPAAPVWGLLAASLAVSTFVVVTFPPVASRLTMVIAVLVPWVSSAAWLAIRRWPAADPAAKLDRVPVFLRWLSDDLTRTLFVVPFLILGAVHLVREPVLVGRGLLVLSPFVVLLMVRGVLSLPVPTARAAAIAVLLALSTAGTYESLTRQNSTRDYRGLGEQLRTQTHPDDLIVVENRWWATPIHYYLPPDRFHLIPPAAVSPPLPPRIWIVMFGPDGLDRAARMAARTLPDYEQRAHLSSLGAHAALFESLRAR